MSRDNTNILTICGSNAYLEERVRLNKLKDILDHNTIKYRYWGWNRTNKKVKTQYPIKHLWKGGGFSNKSLFIHYPIWIFVLFVHSLKLSKKDVVYAVALDVAIPIFLGSIIKGYKFIFDNPDNFSLTYNLKGILKFIINKIEYFVSSHALFHILPDETRIISSSENILIVPNFPLKSEIEKSKAIYDSGFIDGFNLDTIKKDKRLKIYINGRMVFHRGSEWLADIFLKLDQKKFLIISAGDIYCDKLKATLKKLTNVISFPMLENAKALSLYFCSNIVLAFYDPVLPINRIAAPNKWWDCVACQVPFISNDEIETLSIFKDKKACFSVPYGDNNALITLLNSLTSSKELKEIQNNLNRMQIYSWEEALQPLISTVRTLLKSHN